MARVQAKNIVVEFPIYGMGGRSLKNAVMHAATGGILARDVADRIVVRALNGVSFELREGDRVGLVGHNGSGKTTLLRVLAGVYEPVAGSVEVSGRVASMLSISFGMDLEATGYENIFMRGAIMGMRRQEITLLLDEIVDFSGLGSYLHMPLRTYSSGMTMRLAFAISTCVDSDIILMDEWLSVGDASFAEKAAQRLARMLDRAKILVLASHSEALIRKHCNKMMRLERGSIVGFEDIGTHEPLLQ